MIALQRVDQTCSRAVALAPVEQLLRAVPRSRLGLDEDVGLTRPDGFYRHGDVLPLRGKATTHLERERRRVVGGELPTVLVCVFENLFTNGF